MIKKILKPKPKDEIIKHLKDINFYNIPSLNEISEDNFPIFFKICKKYNLNCDLNTYGRCLKLKNTTIYIKPIFKNFLLVEISPVKKIEKLESQRVGNKFFINSLEDFDIIVNFI